MATQPARETWAHASSPAEGVYTLTDGWMDGWRRLTRWSFTTDSTHLNTEDFKGSDGKHQAVDDFVRLQSEGIWERQFLTDTRSHNNKM